MMDKDFSDFISKPEDCVLAFCIPTTIDDFMEDQCNANKEFAKMYNGQCARYTIEVLKHLEKTLPQMQKLGVKVVHRLSLDDFGSLFEKPYVQIIILFAHWTKNDKVEFFDGFAQVSRIVAKIPDNFVGLLDLCVCHPHKLQSALRKNRPRCLARITNVRRDCPRCQSKLACGKKECPRCHAKIPVEQGSTPFFWLYFYLYLFKYLDENGMNYIDAQKYIIKRSLLTIDNKRAKP